jgi:hypothetical protein
VKPLEIFLAGYLNQDLDLIFGLPEDAVGAFAQRAPEEVRTARRGLIDLLHRHPDDDVALIREAVALGCEYNPPIAGELRRVFTYAIEAWATG